MTNNASNATNDTSFYGIDRNAAYTAKAAILTFNIIVGVTINLWYMSSLLSSAELRARFRNKAVFCLLLVNLLETGVLLPYSLLSRVLWNMDNSLGCFLASVSINMSSIQDFIANWTIVIILLTFLAQVYDVDPSRKLTPIGSRVTEITILCAPWAVSVLLMPIIHKIKISEGINCVKAGYVAASMSKSIDTFVPVVAMVTLLVLVMYQKRKRFSPGSTYGVMKAELICRGKEIESVLPYVTMVTIAIVMDFLRMLQVIGLEFGSWKSRYIFMVTAYFLANSRSVVLPFSLLLFSDLRERIWTWRPWYRPRSGIDLTVNYRTEVA